MGLKPREGSLFTYATRSVGVPVRNLSAALLGLILMATMVRPMYALSKEKQEAGEALFHKKGCEYCHGVHGMGSEKAPDLSAVGKRKKRDQIEQQILKGGGGMPAFGEVLQADDVKILVDYLSARKKAGR